MKYSWGKMVVTVQKEMRDVMGFGREMYYCMAKIGWGEGN